MICPKCKSQTLRIKYKIHIDSKMAIIRRRECADCQTKFTTCETIKPPKVAKNEKQFATKSG